MTDVRIGAALRTAAPRRTDPIDAALAIAVTHLIQSAS